MTRLLSPESAWCRAFGGEKSSAEAFFVGVLAVLRPAGLPALPDAAWDAGLGAAGGADGSFPSGRRENLLQGPKIDPHYSVLHCGQSGLHSYVAKVPGDLQCPAI